MKKFTSFLLMMVLAITATTFTGCDKTNEPTNPNNSNNTVNNGGNGNGNSNGNGSEPSKELLIGTWEYKIDGQSIYYTFNADGTLNYSLILGHPQYSGTYTYNSKKAQLILYIDNEFSTLTVLTLTETELSLRDEEGSIMNLLRVTNIPDTPDSNPLIGCWKMTTNDGSYIQFTFNTDSTIILESYTAYDRVKISQEGTYAYDSVNSLFIVTIENETQIFNIISIDETTLVITMGDDMPYTFQKI